MRKLFLLFSIVFVLTSCGDNSKIKEAVRQNLKDPGSAQFEDIIISENNKRACIVWNAKNSMGGYGDWNIAELKKEKSEWIVKEMKGSEEHCSETDFKILDAGDKTKLRAQQRAIEILRKAKNLSRKEANELAISGKCSRIIMNYAALQRYVTIYRLRKESGMPSIIWESLQETRTKLNAGDCE